MATSAGELIGQPRPDIKDMMTEFDLEANEVKFIGKRLAPVIDVKTQHGVFGRLKLKDILQKHVDTKRADDGSYKRGGGKFVKDNFATDDHGFEERIDEREAEIWDSWFDAEVLAAARTRHTVLLDYEHRVLEMVNAITNTTAAAVAWDQTATADPITDVRTAKILIRNRCGLTPNALCVEWEVFEFLRDCDSILDRVKQQTFRDVQKSEVNAAMIAGALGLEELIVAESMENVANEGADEADLQPTWTQDNGLLLVKNASRDLKTPRWANTFHWAKDGSTMGEAFESYDDPNRRSTIIRTRAETEEKVMYAQCAELITGLTT